MSQYTKRWLTGAAVACTLVVGAVGIGPSDGTPVAPKASPLGSLHSSAQIGGPRPNVVLFILDDLGYADTGMVLSNHTNPRGTTPVLDQMSREGVAFTNATASPNCTPTRASLLTGTQGTNRTNRIFAVNGLNFGTKRALLKGPRQGQPDQRPGDEALARNAVTLAETLQHNGYATAAFGKFHVANNHAQMREWDGFDKVYGSASTGGPGQYNASGGRFNHHIEGGLDQFAADYTQSYVDTHVKPFSQGVSQEVLDGLVGRPKNVQDAMADATEQFIADEANSAKPFFMHVGSFAVHEPINPRQPRFDLGVKYGVNDLGTTSRQRVARSYNAILEGADQTLARLVNALQDTPDPRNGGRPMADNTLVFVTSDNGGVQLNTADNGPFRGGKSTTWEGGVRVPWVVWSANKMLVPSGAWRRQEINATDFYPTVVQATASSGANRAIDGVSWWPAVRDARYRLMMRGQARYARVMHMPGYLSTVNSTPQTSLRDGRWKATFSYERGTWALYDVVRDPQERRDLSRRHPAIAKRLALETLAWAKVHDPPLATVKARRTVLVRPHFTGVVYTSAGVRKARNATVRVRYGKQAPLLVPASFAQQRRYWVRR